MFSFYAGAQNAWDMLHEEELLARISTSCSDLDNVLGGGINCREVTEIGQIISPFFPHWIDLLSRYIQFI